MDLSTERRMIALFLVVVASRAVCGTDRPVIGILTQQLSPDLKTHFDPNVYSSYIAASYVKYYESSGARVAPIPMDRSQEYYRELVRHLNGVVFPGGHGSVFDAEGYAPSGRKLLNALEESAKDGHPIPALGVCLGIELMAWHDYQKMAEDIGQSHQWNDTDSPLEVCQVKHVSLSLQYKIYPRRSDIFKRGTEQQIKYLKNHPITANYHKWCITENTLKRSNISDLWTVVATSRNQTGYEFVSVMQAPSRHFYGIQFHPEKNSFEWKLRTGYVHYPTAVETMRLFGDSFVDMCRQNNNSFPADLERQRLIYNYVPADSGRYNLSYEQVYLFRNNELY